MAFVLSGSSSSPIESSSLQSDADENEENNEDQMFEIMPKNPNSAFSKAISSTNEILASEPILNNAHEPFSLQEPRSPQMAASQFTLGKEEFDYSEPYNLLTNFLSPRPQFPRHNPNQLRGTFSNGETEDGFISRSSSSSSSTSVSVINGEICSLTQEEVEEEIKGTNKEIEESDNQEIEGVKVGNSCSEVGTKTWLLLLILAISELFVIFVNCSNYSCGLNIQKDGIEYDRYGTRNLSLEADMMKNFFHSGPSFGDQRALDREFTVNEVWDPKDIKWGYKIIVSEDGIEVIEVDDLEIELEATVNNIKQEKQEEDDEGLETDENLESYARKLSEDELETELDTNEESSTEDEVVSEITIEDQIQLKLSAIRITLLVMALILLVMEYFLR